ncbi:MAG: hypothetical protein K8R36_19545 [Planctomycetales bacterium]|nr:hypothetical protein [Planctomycetales bacterium]
MATKLSHNNRIAPCTNRRGVALIVILGMLAITIAVSYALMRSQVQTTLLQANAQTNNLARQAAEAGLIRAIRRMSLDGDWGGVGTTLSGNADSQSSYSVNFIAGDASLSPADPNYSEYPFRVTVVSTGTAWNSGDNTLPSTYTMSAVLQLVRRALNTSATPSRWNAMNGFTCYQWNSLATPESVEVDAPIQFQGPVCFMGTLQFQQLSINVGHLDETCRTRYISDLNTKRIATAIDYRHFTGNVTLGSGLSRQNASTLTELTGWLGVTVDYATPPAANPMSYPGAPTTYQLYAGGPVYTVGNITNTYGSTPTGQVIGGSTSTNPLGIYKTGGSISLKSGAKFTGVLFSDGSSDQVCFDGTGVELNGVNLPSLSGSSTVYQLPAAMTNNDFVIKNNSNSQVRGLIISWSDLVLESGSQATTFNLQGRVFANDLDFSPRTEWTIVSHGNWNDAFSAFLLQLAIPYFPDFMAAYTYNLQPMPHITFQPPSSVAYHWPDWSQPIYTKANGDSGLRWNIVSWKDGS